MSRQTSAADCSGREGLPKVVRGVLPPGRALDDRQRAPRTLERHALHDPEVAEHALDVRVPGRVAGVEARERALRAVAHSA